MFTSGLKKITPLFFAVVTGCASQIERPQLIGCYTVIHQDTVSLGDVINSKVVGGIWDDDCAKDTYRLEQLKKQNAIDLAEKKAALKVQTANDLAKIENKKINHNIGAQVFKSVVTMEMQNPKLDVYRRNLLVDGIFQHIDNQTAQLNINGKNFVLSATKEIDKLFEVYDQSSTSVEIDNPIVKDDIHKRSVKELIDRYTGVKNPSNQENYQTLIDHNLDVRGKDISSLKSEYTPTLSCETVNNTLVCNY